MRESWGSPNPQRLAYCTPSMEEVQTLSRREVVLFYWFLRRLDFIRTVLRSNLFHSPGEIVSIKIGSKAKWRVIMERVEPQPGESPTFLSKEQLPTCPVEETTDDQHSGIRCQRWKSWCTRHMDAPSCPVVLLCPSADRKYWKKRCDYPSQEIYWFGDLESLLPSGFLICFCFFL